MSAPVVDSIERDPAAVLEDWGQRHPDVLALAKAASIARRVEPELLRELRYGLAVPWLTNGHSTDVGTEAALWFSPLVETRGPDCITLSSRFTKPLRGRLCQVKPREGQTLLEASYRIIEQTHRKAPPLVRWEEELTFLGLQEDVTGQVASRIGQVIGQAGQALAGERSDDFAEAILNLEGRLPEAVRKHPAFGNLRLVSQAIAASARLTPSKSTGQGLDFSAWPQRTLFLSHQNGKYRLQTDRREARFGLKVPHLDPIWLQVLSADADALPRAVFLLRGGSVEIEPLPQGTWLRAIDGKVYQLEKIVPATPVKSEARVIDSINRTEIFDEQVNGKRHLYFTAGAAITAMGANGQNGAQPGFTEDDRGADLLANLGPEERLHQRLPRRIVASKTAYRLPGRKENDPAAYVDAATIPYIALPPRLIRSFGRSLLGCRATVTYQERTVECMVADIDPTPGVISMAAAEKLGIPSSPRTGGIEQRVVRYDIYADEPYILQIGPLVSEPREDELAVVTINISGLLTTGQLETFLREYEERNSYELVSLVPNQKEELNIAEFKRAEGARKGEIYLLDGFDPTEFDAMRWDRMEGLQFQMRTQPYVEGALTPIVVCRGINENASVKAAPRPLSVETTSSAQAAQGRPNVTGEALLSLARNHLGEKYAEGVSVSKNDSQYHGPWESAEFVSWCVYQVSGLLMGCENNSGNPAREEAWMGYWQRDADNLLKKISLSEAAGTPGAILLRYPHAGGGGHIAFSDGQGRTIEAKGPKRGVVADVIGGRRWDTGLLVGGISYDLRAWPPVVPPVFAYFLGAPQMDRGKIRIIQQRLAEVGFRIGPIDGIFGAKTSETVLAFQRANQLLADGEVGPETARALGLEL